MSEKIDTQNHPTVKALVSHQERLELNDSTFARRYVSISAASWSLLKSGKYPAEDPSAMLERCETALRTLEDQAASVQTGPKAQILDLPHVRSALSAVKRCYGEPQNRLVIYMGNTGAGKTTLTRRLREVYLNSAICAEATESWRTSYYYALQGVAEAAGLFDSSTNPRVLETQVFDALAATPRVLAIDEGHYCGPAALNLIKAILNKTPTRVVLIAIPQLWTRMEKKAYEEAKQLRRRTFAKIVVESVTAADARVFLAAKLPGFAGLGDEEKPSIAAAIEAANKFGLYDTLERVCEEVGREMGDRRGDASLDRVKAAIKRVEALRS